MKQEFAHLCLKSLYNKGYNENHAFRTRLKYELKQIGIAEEEEYFLDLHSRKVRFKFNENNLLVAYLLDLVPDFNIENEAVHVQGEFPDIDVDYIPEVQKYIKDEWAPLKFGKDNVCSVGTYGALGIKSAILDVTKVYGVDKSEIQSITVKMEDKDDEGRPLEWDKALEIYSDFRAFCENNPDIAEAAKAMLDRNKSAGVHAGGLIISSQPIDKFVPVEVRKVTKDNTEGVSVSAWTEGLKSQDLQAVGLIKFDALALINLKQIAIACDLILKRHPEIKKICALPNQLNWSDTSYLNDPKSIEMANNADLRCIFQFDSEGIRKLVQRGGVDRFGDLVAYSSLFRPGCLQLGMDARYTKRKKGEEDYFIHPLIEPIIGSTYAVMVYQEQILQILHTVGNIPLIHCEKVRKAISKKKVKEFEKYKEMFLVNGQKNLQANLDFVEKMWDQVCSFSAYGFNAAHATAYTFISARLLWLKSHYPLEFYTAILMCEKDTDKLKDFRVDAASHNIEVRPVHINKSSENFKISDGKIYFGFSNIKGIGKIASEIVGGQPYNSFVDFLDRFGTNAATIKALVSLGVFDEIEPTHDHLTLYKFYEYYKDVIKKREARQKRYQQIMIKYDVALKDLLLTEIGEDHPEFNKMCKFDDESIQLWKMFDAAKREIHYTHKGVEKIREVSVEKQLNDIADKRESSMRNFEQKEADSDAEEITLNNFSSSKIKLDKELEDILINFATHKSHRYYPLAESMYYGFQWSSNIERSPLYKGFTIDLFLQKTENEGVPYFPIEVEITSCTKRSSKKGVEFYTVGVEDSNGKSMLMNVWLDDYLRFKEEFKKGTLVRIECKPPTGGFRTLTFNAPQKRFRSKLPNKEDDMRLMVLPEANEDPCVDLAGLVMNDN